MLTLANLVVYLLEGLAITVAMHLVSRKNLNLAELATLAVTSTVAFIILDLFAPAIGQSARQGSGFGLGIGTIGMGQMGGASLPSAYYGAPLQCKDGQCQKPEPTTMEGMDDKIALQYYGKYNPDRSDLPHTQRPMLTNAVMLTDTAVDEPVVEPVRHSIDPSDTTVRPASLLETKGSYYESLPAEVNPVIGQEAPVYESNLKPSYGFRYRLPRGWDNLEAEDPKHLVNE